MYNMLAFNNSNNNNNNSNNIKSYSNSSSRVSVPAFWTIMEQGIEGICENIYQAHIKQELCQDQKVLIS